MVGAGMKKTTSDPSAETLDRRPAAPRSGIDYDSYLLGSRAIKPQRIVLTQPSGWPILDEIPRLIG